MVVSEAHRARNRAKSQRRRARRAVGLKPVSVELCPRRFDAALQHAGLIALGEVPDRRAHASLLLAAWVEGQLPGAAIVAEGR